MQFGVASLPGIGAATKEAQCRKISEIPIAWITTVRCPARDDRLPEAVEIPPLDREA